VSGTEITAGGVADWVRGFAAAVAEAKDELTALDSAIGDADHGINMNRGMQAVVQKLDADQERVIAARRARRRAAARGATHCIDNHWVPTAMRTTS
jgi:dihydroxyacetone kinase